MAGMSIDADTYRCRFPDCAKVAEATVIVSGDEGVALSGEHRDMLVAGPTEFQRLWDAQLTPTESAPNFQPRRAGDAG